MDLVSVAAVAVIAGVTALVYYFSKESRLKRTVHQAPRTHVASFPNGAEGTIKGEVRRLEELRAPLSGRSCVHVQIVIEEWRSKAGYFYRGWWCPLIEASRSVDFVIEDGSGRAMVETAEARFVVRKDVGFEIEELRHDVVRRPALERFLVDQLGPETDPLDFDKKLRCREGVFEQDEIVWVYGRGQWEKSDRSTKAQLVIGPPSTGTVVITDKPPSAPKPGRY